MAIPTDVEGTWFNTTVSLDAGELRRADGAMFAGDGTTTNGARGGIVRHADTSLAVTVDGSDVVTVQPGAVVVPGNAVSNTGVYRVALPSAITGALAARNATNPRITLVVFRAYDDDVVTTHNAYKGTVEFVDGTPGAVPSAPSLPTMAVELARITVPQTGGGAASVDSSRRVYSSAPGSELVLASSAALPANAPLWQVARALDTKYRYRWEGSAWVQLDTAWTALASSVTSGGISYRRVGDEVWVHVDGAFASTTGTDHTISTGTIPVALRPTPPNGTAYRTGGYFTGAAGNFWVTDTGQVHARQDSGGGKSSVAVLLKYPLG